MPHVTICLTSAEKKRPFGLRVVLGQFLLELLMHGLENGRCLVATVAEDRNRAKLVSTK